MVIAIVSGIAVVVCVVVFAMSRVGASYDADINADHAE